LSKHLETKVLDKKGVALAFANPCEVAARGVTLKY